MKERKKEREEGKELQFRHFDAEEYSYIGYNKTEVKTKCNGSLLMALKTSSKY